MFPFNEIYTSHSDVIDGSSRREFLGFEELGRVEKEGLEGVIPEVGDIAVFCINIKTSRREKFELLKNSSYLQGWRESDPR